MHWNSFDDFIHMGGYGAYVWGSYGVALAAVVIELGLLLQRRRAALARARQTALLSGAGDDA